MINQNPIMENSYPSKKPTIKHEFNKLEVKNF